jgi:hypothetical protein
VGFLLAQGIQMWNPMINVTGRENTFNEFEDYEVKAR